MTAFLTGLLSSIIRPIIQAELEKLKDWVLEQWEIQRGVEAIGKEAKKLTEELDNAQSEAEREAILRKISSFSDLSLLVNNRVHVSQGSAKGD